jgi:hypothetical protein
VREAAVHVVFVSCLCPVPMPVCDRKPPPKEVNTGILRVDLWMRQVRIDSAGVLRFVHAHPFLILAAGRSSWNTGVRVCVGLSAHAMNEAAVQTAWEKRWVSTWKMHLWQIL